MTIETIIKLVVTIFGSLGFWEIALILLAIILLFGGKKIPELMKGLGKGVKSFKEGMKDVEDDVKEIKKEIDSDK